jgi:hypothetical protein
MTTDDLRKRLDLFSRELILHGQQLCTCGQQQFAIKVNVLREAFRILRAEVESRLIETETVCVGSGGQAAVVLPPSAPPDRKRKRGER